MKGVVILVLIIALGGVITVAYLGQDLQKVSVESTEISGVSDLSLEGFSLDGKIIVKNPSQLSVPVKAIEYYVIAQDTNDVIATGVLPSFVLDRKSDEEIPLSLRIYWTSSGKLALLTLTQDQVLVTIKGYLTINIPKLDLVALPFEKTIDIKPYLNDFVRQNIPQNATAYLQSLLEGKVPPSLMSEIPLELAAQLAQQNNLNPSEFEVPSNVSSNDLPSQEEIIARIKQQVESSP